MTSNIKELIQLYDLTPYSQLKIFFFKKMILRLNINKDG